MFLFNLFDFFNLFNLFISKLDFEIWRPISLGHAELKSHIYLHYICCTMDVEHRKTRGTPKED